MTKNTSSGFVINHAVCAVTEADLIPITLEDVALGLLDLEMTARFLFVAGVIPLSTIAQVISEKN